MSVFALGTTFFLAVNAKWAVALFGTNAATLHGLTARRIRKLSRDLDMQFQEALQSYVCRERLYPLKKFNLQRLSKLGWLIIYICRDDSQPNVLREDKKKKSKIFMTREDEPDRVCDVRHDILDTWPVDVRSRQGRPYTAPYRSCVGMVEALDSCIDLGRSRTSTIARIAPCFLQLVIKYVYSWLYAYYSFHVHLWRI